MNSDWRAVDRCWAETCEHRTLFHTTKARIGFFSILYLPLLKRIPLGYRLPRVPIGAKRVAKEQGWGKGVKFLERDQLGGCQVGKVRQPKKGIVIQRVKVMDNDGFERVR